MSPFRQLVLDECAIEKLENRLRNPELGDVDERELAGLRRRVAWLKARLAQEQN